MVGTTSVSIDTSQVMLKVFHQVKVFIQDAVTGEILETRSHNNVSQDATDWVRKQKVFVLGTSMSNPSYRTVTKVANCDMTGKVAYSVEILLTVTAAPLIDTGPMEMDLNGKQRPGTPSIPELEQQPGINSAPAAAGSIGHEFPDIV